MATEKQILELVAQLVRNSNVFEPMCTEDIESATNNAADFIRCAKSAWKRRKTTVPSQTDVE